MDLTTYPEPVYPVIDKNTLLPDVLDFNFKNNPTQPFYIYADPVKGNQVITHLDFGRAAHRVAHALRPQRTGRDGDVVAILAHTDTILYSTIIAGLIVAGLVPFPLSARNTPVAVAELLVKTSCRRWIVTNSALKALTDDTKVRLQAKSYDVEIIEIPTLDEIYPHLGHETADHPFEHYPASSVRPSSLDTSMIIHSSGSTGIPKPIPQQHLYWVQTTSPAELREYRPRLVLGSMALPPFHGFGVGYQIFFPAYSILPAAVFPPISGTTGGSPVVPSPQATLEHAKATGTNAIFTVPAFIQAWSHSEDDINYLKSVEFVTYAGGPLPPKLGNRLAASGVQLYPFYGGTEFGGPTQVLRDKKEVMEWEYMKFFPHISVRWDPQNDGTFECQLLATEAYRPVLFNLPDVEGYATADIFKPHPTKEGFWKIVGRVDDVITHSSGEKTVPGPMEAIILSNPRIQGAAIFGRERPQTGVLIELGPGVDIDYHDQSQLARLRNELWPTIEEANTVAPAFSRIFKEMILFASKDKPLPRAGKGTVMRKAALNAYAQEISALYENVEANITTHSRPASWVPVDVEKWILGQAAEVASKDTLSIDENLFDQGFDSLSATILRLRITHAMRSSGNPSLVTASQKLHQNLVYNAPTIKKLAVYVTSSPVADDTQSSSQTAVIEELITKYSANFGPLNSSSAVSTSGIVVLLTGSTGHLGSYILAELLADDRITQIYAFNRSVLESAPILERHVGRFSDSGLDVNLLDAEKLVFVTGDATQPGLGIEEGLYREISSSVNVVIHNAWQIDFNLSLSSYEPNIASSRHLVDLVQAGPNASHVRFLFISSIGSAQSWENERGPVPEDIIEVSSALGGGYGEAKYIVERMLVNSGLQATSLRLGQISGGRPKGSWPTTEWFPILVKSSVALGSLPEIDGVASWLSADSMAKAIVEIARLPSSNQLPPVVNVVHTKPVALNTVLQQVKDALKDLLHIEVQTIPFNQWLSLVENRGDNATVEDMSAIPAIKLIGFLRQTTGGQMQREFDTSTIQRTYDKPLQVIHRDEAKQWVRYWKDKGYFD